MKTITLMAALMTAGFLMAATEGPDAPALIPFQGRLTDQHGVAYSNAQYSITFCIYRDPAGATPDWTERHEKVGIINGMINVFLGSITPLPGGDYFSKTAYLGITIDSDGNSNTPDPEMVPRQLIVTPFYAKNADKLKGADWSAIIVPGEEDDPGTGHISGAKLADGTVTEKKLSFSIGNTMPTGTILPYAGVIDDEEKLPDGWLLCNGDSYSKNQYQALFDAIGYTWGKDSADPEKFCVPDFRQRTLWGATNDSQDTAHQVGKYLEPALPLPKVGNIVLPGKEGDTSWLVGGAADLPYLTGSISSGPRTAEISDIYKKDCKTVQPPAGCVNFIIKY